MAVYRQPPSIVLYRPRPAALSRPAASAYQIVAEPGSFAVTGVDATLVGVRSIDAQPGSYLAGGPAAQLQVSGTYVLDAQPGSYTITGISATFQQSSRSINAEPGVLTVLGVAATMGEVTLFFTDHSAVALSLTDHNP